VARLSALPKWTCVKPQGAFYAFPNISAYIGKSAGGVKISDAVSFSAALLEQAHVAVVLEMTADLKPTFALVSRRAWSRSIRESIGLGSFLKKISQ